MTIRPVRRNTIEILAPKTTHGRREPLAPTSHSKDRVDFGIRSVYVTGIHRR